MKRLLKWAGIIVGTPILVLTLVLGLFVGWLRWSGERDWKRAEAELRAKGEKLTLAELVPPMPPESENFFADPLWAEYSDLVSKKDERGMEYWSPRLTREKRQLEGWEETPLPPEEMGRLRKLMPGKSEFKTRREAFMALRIQLLEGKYPEKQKEMAKLFLDIIAPATPVLARIEELSKRPEAQFPIRWDLGPRAPLPETTQILKLSQIFAAKSIAELSLGNNNVAAADTLTLLRLTFVQRNTPTLISYLVRLSSVSEAVWSVNEGVELHAWLESDLSGFQAQLERMTLREACLAGLKGERAGCNQCDPDFITAEIISRQGSSNPWKAVQEKIYPGYFSIIFLKDKAYHNLWIQRQQEALNAMLEKGWNASSTQPFDSEIDALAKNPFTRLIYQLNVLSISLSPLPQKAAECQTQVEQTLIACALERYRIAHGAYPTSLEALLPEYLAKLRNSPINGKPMNYSLKPDGTFLLWTPGWNLKSLGGKPGEFIGDGDIVWGQPLPTKYKEGSKATN